MPDAPSYLAPSVLAELNRLDGIFVPMPNNRGLDLPPPIRQLLFGVKFSPDRRFQSREADASHWQFHFGYLYADPDAIAWVAEHPDAIVIGESGGGVYQYFVLSEDVNLSDPIVYRVDAEDDTDYAANLGTLSSFLGGLV